MVLVVPPIAVAALSAGPDTVAAVDQLTALDQSRVHKRAGARDSADLVTVQQGLRASLRL